MKDPDIFQALIPSLFFTTVDLFFFNTIHLSWSIKITDSSTTHTSCMRGYLKKRFFKY